MLAGWRKPAGPDRMWLMYSANYLLRTGGLRWAIDPVRLAHRLPGALEQDPARDLEGLALVVLTHRHEDHLDASLIHSLRDAPITWLVHESVHGKVQAAGVPEGRIVTARVDQPFECKALRLIPFEGLHWEPLGDTFRGVPALGLLAEFGGKRWLFPGDTRSYDASRLPDFGEVDGLVAHVWLGRGCAQTDPPPLLGAFVEFCVALRPRRILLTHLNEFGREPEDLWDEGHARNICEELRRRAPHISAAPAVMGDRVDL
jgi:L-ascorbate metabolism protein UlaG (beta-lactamase superfamily)